MTNEEMEKYFADCFTKAQKTLKPGDTITLCESKIGVNPFGWEAFIGESKTHGKIFYGIGSPPGGMDEVIRTEKHWVPGTVATVISSDGIYLKGRKGHLSHKRRAYVVILINGKLCRCLAENITGIGR